MMLSNSMWKMSNTELAALGARKVWEAPLDYQFDNLTIVCHTSSQSSYLRKMIESAQRLTSKILILDDSSRDDTVQLAIDQGCEVYSIPEGWIYTHGFGELIKTSVSLCRTEYHLQIDTREYVHSMKEFKLANDYMWVLRVHYEAPTTMKGFRQPMNNRIIRKGAKITMPALIHGSPREAQNRSIPHSQIMIFHGGTANDDKYYRDRKNRLYYKLLRKGFEQRKLENSFWYKEYDSKRDQYNRMLNELENRIGVLEETKEDITLVHKGDW